MLQNDDLFIFSSAPDLFSYYEMLLHVIATNIVRQYAMTLQFALAIQRLERWKFMLMQLPPDRFRKVPLYQFDNLRPGRDVCLQPLYKEEAIPYCAMPVPPALRCSLPR